MATLKKKSNRTKLDLAQLEREMDVYEQMSIAEARTRLIAAGYDVDKTIASVKSRVNAKLEEWRKRGVLHEKRIGTADDSGSDDAWHGRHAVAGPLFQEGFELLGSVEVDAVRVSHAADLDAVRDVADRYAALVARSSPAQQCRLIDDVKKLLGRDGASWKLGAAICQAIVRAEPADEARLRIAQLAERDAELAKIVGEIG